MGILKTHGKSVLTVLAFTLAISLGPARILSLWAQGTAFLNQSVRIGSSTPYTLTFPAADAAGVLTSDGAGVLSFAAGVPSNLVAFFSTGSCPTGWTSLSGVGGVLENRFPRGAAAYDDNLGAGFGADTHGHGAGTLAVDLHSHPVDPPSTTSTVNSVDHTHGFTSGTPSGTKQVESGTTSTVALSEHTHSGTTAGQSTTHTHNVDIGSFSSGNTAPGISGSTGSVSHLPAHIKVVYCKKD